MHLILDLVPMHCLFQSIACFPEAVQLTHQPLGRGRFFTVAYHLVGPAAHTAFCCRKPDKILRGFYAPLDIAIFFSDMHACIFAVMAFPVADECAVRRIDILQQVFDLLPHVGMNSTWTKNHYYP